MVAEDLRSDEEVAYHEAGHTVLAHTLGVVRDTTINTVEFPEGTQRGLTRHWIVGLDKRGPMQDGWRGGNAQGLWFARPSR
jgi:hypothetical protein